ncbi:MAG: citrate synthase, partial [Armatimonadota bacterium]|nr:citrate synthase [Armatimonadota bacterium]
DDLADHSNFEEVAYLLWNGRLPTGDELSALRQQLGEAMTLPPKVIDVLRLLPNYTHPMRVLAAATATLGMFDPQADDNSETANRAKAVRLAAELPLITTTWHHISEGSETPPPDPGRSIAYNFLKMLCGKEPDEYAVRTFDAALILHADHELNASTFSARVTAATLSDMHSAVVSAINTLKGPLHGGANEQVMKMLEAIGEPANVEAYMQNLLANKQKVMGFGHRVYKAKDPRAKILEEMSEELGKRMGDTKWFEMSHRVEEIFQPTVASKGVYPNVDFYSASAYHVMGIPRDLFTPIFACSRVVGWTAHLLEQYANNRLFRPDSDYVGNKSLKWVPIEARVPGATDQQVQNQ